MISLQTLLVAIASGAGGAILTTWLRGHFEREERFRERQLAAADDYATGVQQALLELRETRLAILEHSFIRHDGDGATRTVHHPETGEVPAQIEDARRRSQALIDEAHARLARVFLLFGEKSDAGVAASNTLAALRRSWDALNDWPEPDLDAERPAFNEADSGNLAFTAAVRNELRRPAMHQRAADYVRSRARRTSG